MTRLFSGIQPSGAVHLGNYLGALRNWETMQHDADSVYCIVDLHALTLPKEPGEVLQGTLDIAKILLAIGIDPEASTLFVQSQVPEHTELAWLMQTTVSYGELSRMTQFKDKSERSTGFVSAALFTYPALQAADILLYDTDVVPVGDDQRQHIELTRDAAMRFNTRYGDTFVIPEHRIPAAGARVMDLQHPENKMSKSVDSPQGTVGILDDPKTIEKKFKRAVTDNDAEVRYDPTTKPGVSNLLDILAAVTGGDPHALAEGYTQYGPLKADTAAALIELLTPIQQRIAELDDATVRTALSRGAEKARDIAVPVMSRAKKAAGLLVSE
ncbi:MAG: tryptophan--tRNA ligase [Acidimicrobiales bacterium]